MLFIRKTNKQTNCHCLGRP